MYGWVEVVKPDDVEYFLEKLHAFVERLIFDDDEKIVGFISELDESNRRFIEQMFSLADGVLNNYLKFIVVAEL